MYITGMRCISDDALLDFCDHVLCMGDHVLCMFSVGDSSRMDLYYLSFIVNETLPLSAFFALHQYGSGRDIPHMSWEC